MADLLTKLPSQMELLESRQQIARADRNIATIREIAEQRMGSARYSQTHSPGPYQVDVHVDTSGIEEWLEEASEASSAVQDRLESIEGELAWRMDAAMEQAAQSQRVLKEIAVDSRRTQENTGIMSGELAQLKTISGLHLGIATTGLAMQRSANKTLEAIHETLAEGFESLVDSIEDVEDTLAEGFESLELAVVQSGVAIVSMLDSVLEGQRAQTHELGLMVARSSAFVASFLNNSIAALNRAQKERHAQLIRTMREPLSIQAQQKYQDALTNFEVGIMEVALEDLEEVFKLKTTHVLGWILFGQVSFACGRSREAKDAYALAAKYAWPNRSGDPVQGRAYTTAVSLLAGLEYLQGNYAAALAILESGIEKWRRASDEQEYVELCDELCMERIRLLLKPKDPNALHTGKIVPKRLTDKMKQAIRGNRGFWDRVSTRGFWKEATTSPLFKAYAKQLSALDCGPFQRKVQGKRKRVFSTPPPSPPHAPPPRVINYLQPLALEAEPFPEKMVRQVKEMTWLRVEDLNDRLMTTVGSSKAKYPYWYDATLVVPAGYPESWSFWLKRIHELTKKLREQIPVHVERHGQRRHDILLRLAYPVHRLHEWVCPESLGALPSVAEFVGIEKSIFQLLAALDMETK